MIHVTGTGGAWVKSQPEGEPIINASFEIAEDGYKEMSKEAPRGTTSTSEPGTHDHRY